MNPGDLLRLSAACLLGAVAVLSFAIVVRHAWRTTATARHERRIRFLRPELLRLLADDVPDLGSLNTLSRSDAKLVESLVWELIPKLRGAARLALVDWLEHQGAIDDALRQTHRPGAIARAIGAEHLGQAGVASTSKDIERLLDDRHLEVRIVAARALGKMGNPMAVRKLLELLDGPKAIPDHLVAMALIHIGEPAMPALIGGLANPSANARAVCAQLLGYHSVAKASRWLVAVVQFDPSDEVRLAAIVACGRAGSADDVESLSRNLDPERSLNERIAVVRSIGQIGGERAARALHFTMNDPDPQLRAVTARALAGMGEIGAEILTAVSEFGGEPAGQAQDQIARDAIEDNAVRTSASDQSSDSATPT